MRLLITVILGYFVFFSPAFAQISIIQGSDGTNGTLTDLGGGMSIYHDNHGTTGTIVDLGGGMSTYQFRGPNAPMTSGTVLHFGAPAAEQRPALIPSIPAPMAPAPAFPRMAPPRPGAELGTLQPFGTLGSPPSGPFGAGRR